jgi:Protein of unknown function (DUF3256).
MKKFLLFLLLLVSVLSINAQNAKTVFVNMPDSLSPLFTKVNRADFADFLESKMKAQVKNKFDKVSEMKILTSDYLLLQTTTQSTFQLKLLATSDTTKIICTIKTACAPVCDSQIQFFTADWKELPAADYLTPPTANLFFQKNDSTDADTYNAIIASADMNLLKADLSSDNNNITFIFTTPDYLDKESAKVLQPFIKEKLAYEWKDGKFISK